MSGRSPKHRVLRAGGAPRLEAAKPTETKSHEMGSERMERNMDTPGAEMDVSTTPV